MRVRYSQSALVDLRLAARFYNSERTGLGADFRSEVRRAVARIRDFPEAHTTIHPGVRRCIVSRYPYGVFYRLRGREIVIIAVFHLRRDPDRWRERL